MKYQNNDLNLNFEYLNFVTDLNINNELIRGKCYLKILKFFLNLVKKYFKESLFIKKKPFTRTISNILSSLIFSQYIKNNNEDPFIPKLKSLDLLKNIIFDYIKEDECLKNFNIFFDDFKVQYNYNYNFFKNKLKDSKNKYYKLSKQEKVVENKTFYKLNLVYDNNSIILQNILNHIFISKNKYNFLEKKFWGPKNKLDYYIWAILFRYQTLGSNNHQLAILPKIIKNLKKDFKMNMETFGSAINSSSKYFCSLYPDIENFFGSFGNFFDVKFIEGFYNFNPPFQEDIIELGINRIFNLLENSKNYNKKLAFFVTIPVWDTEGKKKLGIKDNFNDFEIINKIKKSKFIKINLVYKKNKFSYLDHNFELIKNTTIQNSYVFVLANYNDNFEKIKKYDFFNQY